jgi:lipopolysaccharide biosynthesis regulator YciM
VKSEFLKLLKQKAQGYEADEVVEEYVNDQDGLKLVKRKVTKKYVPPDTSAVKLLMDLEPNIEDLTDQEILEEIERLKTQIKEELKNGDSRTKT